MLFFKRFIVMTPYFLKTGQHFKIFFQTTGTIFNFPNGAKPYYS